MFSNLDSRANSCLIRWWLALFSVVVFAGRSANAEYAVLKGTPISQGQLRIAEDDFDRLQVRVESPSDQFILEETRVQVEISGLLARVRVSQVFKNPYPERLEALYVFPLPENAAVDSYSFEIDERVIIGEIRRREDARRAYEQARDEGRKAALLEQERANIFSQSVANIPPGAQVIVSIEYVHPVEIDEDRYLFRFPMVVGPRYIPGVPLTRSNVGRGWATDTTEVPDASRITPQHLAPGMRNGNDVFITVHLDAGMPIQEVLAVTHELTTQKTSETEAEITLLNQSTLADKDFVLEYRLAGTETVLASMAHRSESATEGYLLMVLQPKWQIDAEEYSSREVIFVLDRSGSMEGVAISQLRVCAQHLLDSLSPQDAFRIVAFSDTTEVFQSTSLEASPENIEAAKQFVRNIYSGGGTEMLPALRVALGAGAGESARPRYLILMTDALVGNDDSILTELQRPGFSDARVFPIAFGAAPNDYLISRAGELGRGFASQVSNQDNPAVIADRIKEKISAPYMTDLEINWGKLGVKDIVPERLPDLYAGQPLVITARYDTPANGTIALHGNVQGQAVQLELQLDLPEREEAHDSIGTIWARQRIRQIWNRNLGQETVQSREEITELGLSHGLVTQYTSFVAVEKDIPEPPKGALRSEAIANMLPEGMTERGSGQFSAPSAQTAAAQNRPYVPNYQSPTGSGPSYSPSISSGGSGDCGVGATPQILFYLGLLYIGRKSFRRRVPRNRITQA